MNSENKSSGPKPDARQPPKGRNSSKPPAGNSSGAPAERPPRRREHNERREGGEPRDGGERRERPERGERQSRPERGERQGRQDRPERPRRPQDGQPAGAERSKPTGEDRAHRPMVNVKGDITAGSTWAKNGSGPSFADMVRQNASAAAEKASAKSTPPPAKQSPPAQQQHQHQEQPHQQQHQAPPPPVQQAPPAQPEESSEEEEEEVVVMTAIQAPPVVVIEAIPEPPAPVPPVIPPHYVLEIERVVSVKLPSRVTQTAEAQRGAYMFSAQAGKPPTPPPTVQPHAVQPHAVYRPDTANLGARQWSLGTDSRIQQPAQQQPQGWPGAGQLDYWNSSGDRAPASRPFMGSQAQTPYNSYPSTVPLSHQRPASNAFPMRFRSSEVPESGLRQQAPAPFNRPPQTTNGGGVW